MPPDFRKAAEHAYSVAVQLAQRFDSEIIVVHIQKDQPPSGLLNRILGRHPEANGLREQEVAEFRDTMSDYREIADDLNFDLDKIRHIIKEGVSSRNH